MAIVTDGLFHYWHSRDGIKSGNVLNNIAPGQSAKALSVANGSQLADGSVRLPLNGYLNTQFTGAPYESLGQPYSFEILYTPRTFGTGDIEIIDSGLYVMRNSTNALYVEAAHGGGSNTPIYTASSSAFGTAEPLLLTFVYDGSLTIRTYINGVLLHTGTITATNAFAAGGYTDLSLFRGLYAPQAAADVWAVRYYTKALSAAEVTQNFGEGTQIGLGTVPDPDPDPDPTDPEPEKTQLYLAPTESDAYNFTGNHNDLQDPPNTPDANWMLGNAEWGGVRLGFQDLPLPPEPGVDLQRLRVRVRKNAHFVTADAISVVVAEDRVNSDFELASQWYAMNETETEITYQLNWDASGLADKSGNRVVVIIEGKGYDIGAVEWRYNGIEMEYTPYDPPEPDPDPDPTDPDPTEILDYLSPTVLEVEMFAGGIQNVQGNPSVSSGSFLEGGPGWNQLRVKFGDLPLPPEPGAGLQRIRVRVYKNTHYVEGDAFSLSIGETLYEDTDHIENWFSINETATDVMFEFTWDASILVDKSGNNVYLHYSGKGFNIGGIEWRYRGIEMEYEPYVPYEPTDPDPTDPPPTEPVEQHLNPTRSILVSGFSGYISYLGGSPNTSDANWYTGNNDWGVLKVGFPTLPLPPTPGAGLQRLRFRVRKNSHFVEADAIGLYIGEDLAEEVDHFSQWYALNTTTDEGFFEFTFDAATLVDKSGNRLFVRLEAIGYDIQSVEWRYRGSPQEYTPYDPAPGGDGALHTDSLIAYYNPKNEAQGATALTNVAPGGATAPTTLASASVGAGGALRLAQGKASHAVVPHLSGYTSPGSWTFEYLFQPVASFPSGATTKLWEAEADTIHSVGSVYRDASTGRIEYTVFASGGAAINVSATASEVMVAQPIHLMIVHDAVAGTLTTYVNAEQKHTQPVVPVSFKLPGQVSNFDVNESNSSIALDFQAWRFYTKALNAAQRSDNFGNGTDLGLDGTGGGTPTQPLPTQTQVPVKAETQVFASGSGDIADSPMIWYNKDNPSQSLVLGTNKASNGGIAVYNLDGSIRQFVSIGACNNVDVRDGVFNNRILVMTTNRTINAITFAWLDRSTRQLTLAGSVPVGFEPYGGCLYVSPVNGDVYAFVTENAYANGQFDQYRLSASGNTVSATKVRDMSTSTLTEGVAAQDSTGYLFVAVEDEGLYRYNAEPNGGTSRVTIDTVGRSGGPVADLEGIALAQGPNPTDGYIIVSSQGDSSFHMYNLAPPHAWVKKFVLVAGGSADAVQDTDGISVMWRPMGTSYPQGLFVAHDAVNSGSSISNYKFVDASLILGNAPQFPGDPTTPTDPGDGIVRVKIADFKTGIGDILPIYDIADNPNQPLRVRVGTKTGFFEMTDVNASNASRVRLQTPAGLKAIAFEPGGVPVDPTPTDPTPPTETRFAHLHPFSETSVWNTAMGSGAQFASTGDITTTDVRYGNSYINSDNGYGISMNIAQDGDPIRSVFYQGRSKTHRIPENPRIEAGTDGNMNIIDGGVVYEYWLVERRPDGNYNAGYGVEMDLLGSGIYGGIRAASFSTNAGLIRKHELQNRYIPHALVMALHDSRLQKGPVWPAITEDGSNGGYVGSIRMGSLFAIPPSVNINALGLSPVGLALARCLQDYGVYVGDKASQLTLYASDDVQRELGSDFNELVNSFRNTIRQHLRMVTNSTQNSVGGGGTRRQPTLPPVIVDPNL